MSMLPVLPLARYHLTFQAVDAVRLPAYAGSAWRGVFGRALKRLVCVTREPACPACLLYRSCVYPYVFETPPDPAVGKLRKYTAAPHPFILIPTAGGAFAPGAVLTLGLTLFGQGARYLPYILQALLQAGHSGIGTAGGGLQLLQVEQADGATDHWQPIYTPGGALTPQPPVALPVPPLPDRFALLLATPLRLKTAGHHLTPAEFRFGALFAPLLRRISLLTAFHTATPLETNFAALVQAAWAVAVESCELRWHDWTRYSSRQHTLLQMGGLLGEIRLGGAGLDSFWPYLWLGQWTHAGKGASMGLGRYRIEPR